MPRVKQEVVSDPIETVTDVTSVFFREDGVRKVKKTFWNGELKLREEVGLDK